MGVVQANVSVGRRTWTSRIDGRCASGCLPGQGFYFMHVVAADWDSDLRVAGDGALVTLLVVPSDTGSRTRSAKFCLASVIGANV
jgi:hypothetical protein